jgi:ABC-type transport system substrate-binding protein
MHTSDEGYNTGQVPLIVEDLAQVGIRVAIVRHELDEIRRKLETPGHNLLVVRNWFADFPDPDNFFWTFFHSTSSVIPGMNFRDEGMERMIETARRTVDIEERTAMYRQLNARVIKDAPFVPLFHERFFILHRPDVRELRPCLVTPPVRYDRMWLDR